MAVSLSEFKESLNQMVTRGLISASEAKQYIIEYQFKLENADDKISENLAKREPASLEFKKVKIENN